MKIYHTKEQYETDMKSGVDRINLAAEYKEAIGLLAVQQIRNEELQDKLDISTKALKKIEVLKNLNLSDKAKVELSFKLSHEAIVKMMEIERCQQI